MLVVPLDQVLPGNRRLVLGNAVAAEVVDAGSSKAGRCQWLLQGGWPTVDVTYFS